MAPSSAPGYPAPGARIGRFRIMEQLGQGGMGVVFRAMEENLGREVALKVIAPLFAHDPEFRARFTREAQAQASLESVHVVAVYAHGEEDGYLYIATQLIPGGDLGELIRTEGTPSLVDALDVIEQVASGLADAHAAGLVHRDIKPGNVLVRRRPGAYRAYLADFGIARRMNADATRFSATVAGTPAYMAPELHGGAKASVVTDIYALGCVLWVALTGTPPYQARSEYELVAAHLQQPVPQLAGQSPMVHAANRILRIAMAKEPSERYSTAAEMGADLQAALRMPVTPGVAVPQGKGRTAIRPVRPEPAGAERATSDRHAPRRPAEPEPAAPPAHQPPGRPHPAPPPVPAYLAGTGPVGPAGRRTSSGRWWALAGVAALAALGAGATAALLTAEEEPAADDFLALSAEEQLRESEMDMAVVKSARIRGEFQQDDDRVSVDVVATTAGDCRGTMTSRASGGSAEVLSVGDNVYLRADAAFWDGVTGEGTAEQVLPLIGDRWVIENSLKESTESFCDLDEFLERDGREDATVSGLGPGRVDDQESVKVEQSAGPQREVLYIRVAEPHYLLRVEESDVDYFEFSGFDAAVDIQPPPAADVVDIEKLLEEAARGAG